MPKKKYYVVWIGLNPGVYESWTECEKQIKGYTGAVYKSYMTKELAIQAYQSNYSDHIGQNVQKNLSLEEKVLLGRPILKSICVDAACSGNPGELEYQGVDTKTGKVLFKKGPFREGTQNIGEFLAIVHGLGYLKQKNLEIPVYSDSKTAIKWAREKNVKTKLTQSPENKELFDLLERALIWLKNNNYPNRILKWETSAWGEIPADFGRK